MSDASKPWTNRIYISAGNILGAAAVLFNTIGVIYLITNPRSSLLVALLFPEYAILVVFDTLIAILVFRLFMRHPSQYAALGLIAILVVPLYGAMAASIITLNYGIDSAAGNTVTYAVFMVLFVSYLFDYVWRLRHRSKEKVNPTKSRTEVQRRLSKLEKG